MFVLVLPLLILALAAATSDDIEKQPYDEDPKHFHEQYFLHAVTIYQKLYAKIRNYNTESTYRCQSAGIAKRMADKHYIYRLSARHGLNATDPYVQEYALATLFKTGTHGDYNAANFTMLTREQVITYKLMTTNTEETCFVFAVERGGNKTECEVLMTAGTVNGSIPEQCERVYYQECTEPHLTLYDDTCK